MGSMLPYIAAPWILWVCIYQMIGTPNVSIYTIHLNNDNGYQFGYICYQIINDWYIPTGHLPTAEPALGARGTFPSRHQTENSWLKGTRASPMARARLQWFPRSPIEVQYWDIWGLFWDIWGLFSHRIHGAAIYGNMDPINIPPLC